MVLVGGAGGHCAGIEPGNRVLGLVSYAWAGWCGVGPVVLFSVMWSYDP